MLVLRLLYSSEITDFGRDTGEVRQEEECIALVKIHDSGWRPLDLKMGLLIIARTGVN